MVLPYLREREVTLRKPEDVMGVDINFNNTIYTIVGKNWETSFYKCHSI